LLPENLEPHNWLRPALLAEIPPLKPVWLHSR
jgi:hypothetical protein